MRVPVVCAYDQADGPAAGREPVPLVGELGSIGELEVKVPCRVWGVREVTDGGGFSRLVNNARRPEVPPVARFALPSAIVGFTVTRLNRPRPTGRAASEKTTETCPPTPLVFAGEAAALFALEAVRLGMWWLRRVHSITGRLG